MGCNGNTSFWLKALCLVGATIWATPLIWYYKHYKKENQQ